MTRLSIGRDSSVIGKHVRNVFSEEELDILPNRQNLPICGKIRPELSEDPEPFLSKDRKMIGFNVEGSKKLK